MAYNTYHGQHNIPSQNEWTFHFHQVYIFLKLSFSMRDKRFIHFYFQSLFIRIQRYAGTQFSKTHAIWTIRYDYIGIALFAYEYQQHKSVLTQYGGGNEIIKHARSYIHGHVYNRMPVCHSLHRTEQRYYLQTMQFNIASLEFQCACFSFSLTSSIPAYRAAFFICQVKHYSEQGIWSILIWYSLNILYYCRTQGNCAIIFAIFWRAQCRTQSRM